MDDEEVAERIPKNVVQEVPVTAEPVSRVDTMTATKFKRKWKRGTTGPSFTDDNPADPNPFGDIVRNDALMAMIGDRSRYMKDTNIKMCLDWLHFETFVVGRSGRSVWDRLLETKITSEEMDQLISGFLFSRYNRPVEDIRFHQYRETVRDYLESAKVMLSVDLLCDLFKKGKCCIMVN